MATRKIDRKTATGFQSYKAGPLVYKRDGAPEARETHIKQDKELKKLDAIAHAKHEPLGFTIRVRKKDGRILWVL